MPRPSHRLEACRHKPGTHRVRLQSNGYTHSQVPLWWLGLCCTSSTRMPWKTSACHQNNCQSLRLRRSSGHHSGSHLSPRHSCQEKEFLRDRRDVYRLDSKDTHPTHSSPPDRPRQVHCVPQVLKYRYPESLGLCRLPCGGKSRKH